MTDFNSYMGNIDTDFFRELCLRNGELRYYKRNEFILREGEVGSFFGFIVSGVIKYTCINQTENKTYNVNAARKSKVDDNTAKMQSIKQLGV